MALTKRPGFLLRPLFPATSEQLHLPVLALEVLESCGFQPADDARVSRRKLWFEQAVGDVVEQTLDEIRRSILLLQHSLVHKSVPDRLEHPNGPLEPIVRGLFLLQPPDVVLLRKADNPPLVVGEIEPDAFPVAHRDKEVGIRRDLALWHFQGLSAALCGLPEPGPHRFHCLAPE